MMECFDENFEIPFAESELPIYRCTSLGQTVPPLIMGCQSKANGERTILELAGVPLRDNGAYGQHIGGMITLRNVTAERLKRREETEQQGDLYFKSLCDIMPQLVWVAETSGSVEWYSKSWYDYTGANFNQLKGSGWTSAIHEEDLAEAGRRWSHSLRTGSLYETAYRMKRFDGDNRWFLARALPMKNKTTGVMIK
jgi:PAS domain S-box-containing protein